MPLFLEVMVDHPHPVLQGEGLCEALLLPADWRDQLVESCKSCQHYRRSRKSRCPDV